MKSVLVLAPHADDEVLGCGGLIARTVQEGGRVAVCVVTVGAPHLFDEQQTTTIREEALAAHKLLGVSRSIFLEFHAPLLDRVERHRLSDAIRECVHDQNPDTVLLPHQGDIHHDHRVVHEAALVACRPIGENNLAKILAYETLSETEWASPKGDSWFIPTVYADIADYIDIKVQAMQLYDSQLRCFPHPRSEGGIRALAAHRGGTVGFRSAEAFMLVRETI